MTQDHYESLLKRTPQPSGNVEDVFKRQSGAEVLADLIVRGPSTYVYSVEGPFGSGKSHYIRQVISRLESTHKISCCIFNAWESDFQSHALVALVDQIISKYESEESVDAIKQVKAGTSSLFKNLLKNTTLSVKIADPIGILSAEVSKTVGGNTSEEDLSIVDQYHKTYEDVKNLKNAVAKLLSKHRLVVFIDELDRCRPSYAIEILECIKHLLDIPNLCFVLSIDRHQICSIVSTVFGATADTEGYLTRFIDFRTQIPAAENPAGTVFNNLISNFHGDEGTSLYNLINFLIRKTGPSLRELEQIKRTLLVYAGDYNRIEAFLTATLLTFLFYKKRSAYESYQKTETIEEIFKSFNLGIPENFDTQTLHVFLGILSSISGKSIDLMQEVRPFYVSHNLSTSKFGENLNTSRGYMARLNSFEKLVLY